MIKCKIFEDHRADKHRLQSEINEWLLKYPDIKIINLGSSDSSSQHGSRLRTVYIFYEVKEEIKL